MRRGKRVGMGLICWAIVLVLGPENSWAVVLDLPCQITMQAASGRGVIVGSRTSPLDVSRLFDPTLPEPSLVVPVPLGSAYECVCGDWSGEGVERILRIEKAGLPIGQRWVPVPVDCSRWFVSTPTIPERRQVQFFICGWINFPRSAAFLPPSPIWHESMDKDFDVCWGVFGIPATFEGMLVAKRAWTGFGIWDGSPPPPVAY